MIDRDTWTREWEKLEIKVVDSTERWNIPTTFLIYSFIYISVTVSYPGVIYNKRRETWRQGGTRLGGNLTGVLHHGM